MSAETDIVQILELLRINNFLAKIQLKRHQRRLIPTFRYYNLELDKLEVPDLIRPPPNVFEVLRNFDPSSNEIDRRMLFEITGKKVSTQEDAFWDSSDENEIKGHYNEVDAVSLLPESVRKLGEKITNLATNSINPG